MAAVISVRHIFLLTATNHYVINILLALKQRGHILDLGAVPSDSTIITL